MNNKICLTAFLFKQFYNLIESGSGCTQWVAVIDGENADLIPSCLNPPKKSCSPLLDSKRGAAFCIYKQSI